jgi:hypothetical protein
MPRLPKVVLSICVLSVGLVAAASWPWLGGSRPIEKKSDDSEVKATRARDTREAHRLIDLKNEALADLENGQFVAADSPFFQLATAGTREAAGGRNWLISRIIALQSIDPKRESAAYEEAVERAQRALNLENALEPKSPIRHYLAGKVAQARRSTKQRIFEQHIAAGTAPADPVQWAELYEAQTSSGNASDRRESEGTLRTLKDLASDNLYAQLEWLGVQSRRKDAQIVDTLSRLRNLLIPLLPEPKDGANSSVDRLLNETQSAAKAASWETVARNVTTIVETARRLPEVGADRRRIQRDLSWFVVSDFSHGFYQKHRVQDLLRRSSTRLKPGSSISTWTGGSMSPSCVMLRLKSWRETETTNGSTWRLSLCPPADISSSSQLISAVSGRRIRAAPRIQEPRARHLRRQILCYSEQPDCC